MKMYVKKINSGKLFSFSISTDKKFFPRLFQTGKIKIFFRTSQDCVGTLKIRQSTQTTVEIAAVWASMCLLHVQCSQKHCKVMKAVHGRLIP